MTTEPTTPSEDSGTGIVIRPFTESLPMALLQARESAMRLFRPMLATHGLTEQQWRVLRALSAAPQPLDAGALAQQTFLLAPSISRILNNLADRSLIERSTNPDDQRQTLIDLSADGRALVTSVAPQSESLYNRIESGFGRERLERLLSELHDLAAFEHNPGHDVNGHFDGGELHDSDVNDGDLHEGDFEGNRS